MIADVQQIFDVSVDPLDKERLLRGATNIAVCPSCGYQSQIAMPIVYHDPEKELLLIVVDQNNKQAVLDAIRTLDCLSEPGSGIAYSAPVSDFTLLGKKN